MCDICEKNWGIYTTDMTFVVGVEGKKLTIEGDFKNDSVEINYCPECGKELGEWYIC